MTDAIVEKLRQHLSDPVDTECKVVYLLCEIRKLLDKPRPEPTLRALRQLFALRLYCNWALHIHLSKNTTMALLEKVDRIFINRTTPGSPETGLTIVAEHHLFREFVYLETFRKELSQFLTAYGLRTSLCDEDVCWFAFLAAYEGVIEDGSLTCESKNSAKLRVVEKITFTKGPRIVEDSHVPFGIVWKILLKDGSTIEVNVGAPSNAQFLSWGLRWVSK
jgi:hypothetical protein